MKRQAEVKGITLLDAMVSILIFSIVIVGVLVLFAQGQRAALEAKCVYTAANLAKNRLERLKTVSYELLADANETDVRLDENGIPGDSGMFVRNTSVNTAYVASGEASASGMLTGVTVEVDYYLRGERKNKPVRLIALFVQRRSE